MDTHVISDMGPPVLVGERVAWLGSGTGLPMPSTVRWIGHIPEITDGWTVGIELDNAMPFGGIDGAWRKRKLFDCKPKHGLLVPINKIMKQSSLLKTRHSLGENFYNENVNPLPKRNQDIIRKLSLPQSASSREFLSKVLPPVDTSFKPIQAEQPEFAPNFKSAAKQIQGQQESTAYAHLTVTNVRQHNNGERRQTLEELEKFKKHFNELVRLKTAEQRSRKKKIGNNPESLYNFAQPIREQDECFLRLLIEEKNDLQSQKAEKTKKTEPVLLNSIGQEALQVISEGSPLDNSRKNRKNLKKLEEPLREATVCVLSGAPEEASEALNIDAFITSFAEENVEEGLEPGEIFWEQANVLTTETDDNECLILPTPISRKKRNPPVPTPRRRSSDVRNSELFDVGSGTIRRTGSQATMSDVRGTFRRIDEDELDRKAPIRRVLTASLSAPGGSRTKLFSFFKWFKRDKRKNDVTLESLNVPSVPSSPVFARNRLANAESVDTLSSLATVSSFAFLSGAEYRNLGSNRKKRKAPLPPPRKDVSLPNTLQCRVRAQHRRSSSESSKGRSSASFLHVNGKRKAPPPPPTSDAPTPKCNLYPSLSSLSETTVGRKKPPAPPPPVTIKPPENDAVVIPSSAPPEESQTNAVSNPEIAVAAPSDDEIKVCTDTLTLEKGILKPTKPVSPSPTTSGSKSVPVSPRPWYKRKSLEKRKEKTTEKWMPEVGIARPVPPPSPETAFTKLNFFFEKKKDEKRKSGISLLANISELDREAAEICRKEQNHQQQLIDDNDSKFYGSVPVESQQASSKKSSTKELISLFNAIGSSSNSCVLTEPHTSKETVQVDSPLEIRESDVGNTDYQIVNSASKTDELSTISEMSEPSSSMATLNYYAERVWICTRCTLENLLWKNRCDACSACKPNYNRINDKRKSEMEFNIDWEEELQKYFPLKVDTLPGQTTKSKLEESNIKTEVGKGPNTGDLNELRKKRLEFFMKSLGKHQVTSVRDAAAKKSLDEGEKSKLKGMLKEMKESILKDEAATKTSADVPNDSHHLLDSNKIEEDKSNYGAIRKTHLPGTKSAEALLVTTTTVIEDTFVRRKEAENLKIQGIISSRNNVNGKSVRQVVDKPFQLMRARDLANIIESKSDLSSHTYANEPFKPQVQLSEVSLVSSTSNDQNIGLEVARLASQLTRASGVAEFKASLDQSASNTLAVNRLLRRLEAAISAGRHDQAATLARELAYLKVNCSVTRSRSSSTSSPISTPFFVEMFVEDKVSHQGPIPVKVFSSMTLGDLKMKIQKDFQIPCHVQRWILGRQLATEEYLTLQELGVSLENCSIFLYLVAPDPVPEPTLTEVAPSNEKSREDSPEGAKALPPHPGKGWYYNYEFDRYSFCDSESETSPERDISTSETRTSSSNGKEEKKKSLDEVKTEKGQSLFSEQSPPSEKCEKAQTQFSEQAALNPTNSFEVTSNTQRLERFEERMEESKRQNAQLNGDSVEVLDMAESKAAAVRVIQRTIDNARAKSKSSSPLSGPSGPSNDSKANVGIKEKKPLKTSVSLPESSSPLASKKYEKDSSRKSEAKRKMSADGKAISVSPEKRNGSSSSPVAQRQRSRSIFDLIKPQSNDTLKKDLKVISVNAVKETIEKLSRRTEDVEKNGWRCETCTLVNPVKLSACSACTSLRPEGYNLPAESPAQQELKRLRRDQAMDLPFPLTLMDEVADDRKEVGEKEHYMELVNLDNADLVVNAERFDCPVCFLEQDVGQGVVLRDCLHNFCRGCLIQTVEFSEEAEVKCPYRDENYSCDSVLLQREIKALVPKRVFEQHLARSISQAENQMGNAFHCKTPDCEGWCILEDNVNEFKCPVCKHVNCLTCRAIHEGMNCRTYQMRLNDPSQNNAEANTTRSMLEEMVEKGDAMACPTCQVVLMKKWGCDWLRCSMCKTEICWVTRGPRWGPAGKGDTSAGCQCGVNGVKCHPKCNYCH